MSHYPRKWAVLVGVTKYDHYESLKFSTRDVVKLGEILQAEQGFKVEAFHDEGALPVREAILHYIGGLKDDAELDENDLLIFYFSGHGNLEPKEKKDHLLPRNATPKALRQTGLKVEDVIDLLKEAPCKDNVVLFFDACRELAGDRVAGAKGGGTLGDNTRQAIEQAGFVAFFSCGPDDLSWEIDELQHGSFTYCLLEALRKQKSMTVEELFNELAASVPLVNDKHGKPPQRPHLVAPDGKRKLPLFQAGGQSAQAVTESLQARLAERFVDDRLDPKIFQGAFNALAKEPPLDDITTKRQRVIIQYCSGDLGRQEFEAAWKAIDRLSSGPTKLGSSPVKPI